MKKENITNTSDVVKDVDAFVDVSITIVVVSL